MIQVIEAHEDYLIIRSDLTGRIYGARFVIVKGEESLLAAPIAEFMSGEALKPAKPVREPRKALPRPRAHGGGIPKGTGPRYDKIRAWFREHPNPIPARELGKIAGVTTDTDIYRLLRTMEELGELSTVEQPEVVEGRNIRIRRWFPASSEAPERAGVPS